MNQPKVSVIVAVFNAEKTLDRLCQSLVSQTMTDFEVLLIDDGSTDASGAVCDKYAGLDSRFKAFHKSNEGIGSTRQFGIDHATGEYTIHADADDWVEPDYLESLHKEAISTQADMVICDYWIERGYKSTYMKQQPEDYSQYGILLDLLRRLQNGPCNKLIKRDSYLKNGISYNTNLDYGEDQLFNLQLVLSGATVSYVPKALYHYDNYTCLNSASRGCSAKIIRQQEMFLDELCEFVPETLMQYIDDKRLDIVYSEIKLKRLTGVQFKNKYSSLKHVKWEYYYKRTLTINMIIWISLHVSYHLAIYLENVKARIIKMLRYE